MIEMDSNHEDHNEAPATLPMAYFWLSVGALAFIVAGLAVRFIPALKAWQSGNLFAALMLTGALLEMMFAYLTWRWLKQRPKSAQDAAYKAERPPL